MQLLVEIFHEVGRGLVGDAPECHQRRAGAGGEKGVREPDHSFSPNAAAQCRLTGREGDQISPEPQPADPRQVELAVAEHVLKMAAGSKLPIGNYQVELLENGVAVTKIPFKVGAGESGGADVAATATGAGAETEEEGEAPPAATTEESPGDTTEVSEVAAEPAVAAAEAAGPPSSSGGAVLAMHETKWPGVLVELTELTRKGSTLYAKLRFTNKGDKEIRPDFYYRDTYVLDENNKKYEVLKDEKDAYLGSVASGYTYWWGENIDPGASRTVWMRFAPPPAGVRVVTVQVGTMDPFEDVAIQN